MTQIGAFRCLDGVVLFADRQETVPDYAKWDTNKIYLYEAQGLFRVAMTGAGNDANVIDMVWEGVVGKLGAKKLSEIKEAIVHKVHEVTKKAILPMPSGERPYCDLIWIIQPVSSEYMAELMWGPDIFRTHRFAVNQIDWRHFSGSSVLLNKFLSDQFINNVIIGVDEAEALATYILWEAKEYDPYVGKYSDVLTFKRDGTIAHLSRPDADYWEEHWRHFKESLRYLPLLSCAGAVTQQVYDPEDYLDRLQTTIKTLNAEQKKMRGGHKTSRSDLEERLSQNIREVATKHLAKPPTSS